MNIWLSNMFQLSVFVHGTERQGAWPWDPQTAHILSSVNSCGAWITSYACHIWNLQIAYPSNGLVYLVYLMFLIKIIIWRISRINNHPYVHRIYHQNHPCSLDFPSNKLTMKIWSYPHGTTHHQPPSHWCAASVAGLAPAAGAWRPPATVTSSPLISR